MQKTLFRIFTIIAAAIFIAKISAWFADYSDSTKNFINAAMFVVIGAYIFTTGIFLDKLSNKILFMLCGIFLMVFKFFPENAFLSIAAILSILIPVIIGKNMKLGNDSNILK